LDKRGLGKGLGALIPGADKEIGSSSNAEIEVANISVNPYQPREMFNDDKFQELVNSVRVHGVLQPIVVRTKSNNEYELVAGERRLRAARTAGLTKIPAVVRELTNEQSLQVALVENIQREDINAIEAAIAYKRLSEEFGLSQEDLAFGLGKSRSTIANTLRLLGLPKDIKENLRAGKITEGHARAILSVDTEELQAELCKKIIGAGLSVRDSEKLARDWSQTTPRASKNVSRETNAVKQDPNVQQIESDLRNIFGTKVSIIKNQDRGRIEIEFYSDDDLERLLNLLAGG
jgi:ParB family transcriptional regulator, chromosome partitioning protein